MLDLPAQHARIAGEIDAAIARVISSGGFVRGAEVLAAERAIADYCEAGHAVACGSGSDALLLALMARGIGPGDRVICPALTFFSTAAAVTRLGAVPVFADVDPDSFCVDAAAVREAVARGGRPRALIAVHLFGRAAPIDELLELAAELDVPLVEDVAQAIGARDAAGRRAGSGGDAGCLSFYPSKNLGALGDGGMILTDDGELAERLRLLRDHGTGPGGLHHVVGINSRLDAIQAAVLRVKLPHLDDWTNARQERAARYHDALVGAGAGVGAGSFEGLGLPVRVPSLPPRPARHVLHHYVVRVPEEDREPLRARLAQAGIESGVYYPTPLHQQPCFAGVSAGVPRLPHAEAAARENIAIPVHPELGKEQQARVITAIRGYFDR
jgi:dTDP-4-amino-4,6-dideoxygalactose transaminase